MGCVQANPKDQFEKQSIKFINKLKQIKNILSLLNKRNSAVQHEYVKAKYEYSQQLPSLIEELHDEYKRLEDIYNEQDKKFMMSSKEKSIKCSYLGSCREKVKEYELSSKEKCVV